MLNLRPNGVWLQENRGQNSLEFCFRQANQQIQVYANLRFVSSLLHPALSRSSMRIWLRGCFRKVSEMRIFLYGPWQTTDDHQTDDSQGPNLSYGSVRIILPFNR